MNKLIITAHPSSLGFTHRIAKSFVAGAEEAGHNFEILDLCTTELKQDFLCFENKEDMSKPDPVRQKIQDKISGADEIVFVHPLWWGGPPAILKNFLDQNLTSGFAYKYISRKHIPKSLNILPQGLLAGKKVRLFITFDAPLWVYFFLLFPFLLTWYFFVIKFCGMSLGSVRLYSSMRNRGEEVRTKWLERVKQLGAK